MNAKQFSHLALTGLATIVLGGIGSSIALGKSSLNVTTVRRTALSKHNAYRATHHSPKLTQAGSLNTTAQSWAEYLATNALFEHSSPNQRNNAGENLYVYYTTGSSISATTLANETVKAWYDEVADYDYANPGFSSETGHFTQVVWKSTTQLGCGAAQGRATLNGTTYNAFYVVCHYAPAGNFTGQFPQNVLQP